MGTLILSTEGRESTEVSQEVLESTENRLESIDVDLSELLSKYAAVESAKKTLNFCSAIVLCIQILHPLNLRSPSSDGMKTA